MLAQLHFATGARAEALTAVRECVKLDGDTKAYNDLCVPLSPPCPRTAAPARGWRPSC